MCFVVFTLKCTNTYNNYNNNNNNNNNNNDNHIHNDNNNNSNIFFGKQKKQQEQRRYFYNNSNGAQKFSIKNIFTRNKKNCSSIKVARVPRFNHVCNTWVLNLPMQFLGPAEKGMYAYGWRRISRFLSRNLSGLNRLGSSQWSGWRWSGPDEMA